MTQRMVQGKHIARMGLIHDSLKYSPAVSGNGAVSWLKGK